MGSTVGQTATAGHAIAARPGIWLTDVSLVVMAIIWGVNFTVVKYGTSLIDPLAYNGLRVALAVMALVAAMLVTRAPFPSRRETLALLGLGVLGNGFYQYLFVLGVARTSASDAALVIAATPAFVAIIGRLRGTERTNARRVAGIALSIAGMAFVVLGATSSQSAGSSSLVGDLIMLAASLSWATYTVLLKPYTERVGGLQLSALTMVGGGIPLIAFCLPAMTATSWAGFPRLGWVAAVYSGVGSLVLAYALWYRGVRLIGATRTAMYSNLQPVVAVAVAWALLGELPTGLQLVGALSIMGGLLLTRA